MWMLTICTAGWVLCGQIINIEYKTKQECYESLNELYKRQKSTDFKYIICAEKGKLKND